MATIKPYCECCGDSGEVWVDEWIAERDWDDPDGEPRPFRIEVPYSCPCCTESGS